MHELRIVLGVLCALMAIGYALLAWSLGREESCRVKRTCQHRDWVGSGSRQKGWIYLDRQYLDQVCCVSVRKSAAKPVGFRH